MFYNKNNVQLSIWILQSILVMKHDVATSDCLSSLLKYLLEKCLNSAVPSNIEHIAICLSFIITVLKQSGSEGGQMLPFYINMCDCFNIMKLYVYFG